MGKADYLQSFKQYADRFICTLLPGASHPQIQYSPGLVITIFFCISISFVLLQLDLFSNLSKQVGLSSRPEEATCSMSHPYPSYFLHTPIT